MTDYFRRHKMVAWWCSIFLVAIGSGIAEAVMK